MKKLLIIISLVLLAAGCNPSNNQQSNVNTGLANQSANTTATPKSAAKTSTQVQSSPTAVIKSPSKSPVQTKLKITASSQGRSVAFTSEENYTNCNDNLTVITVNQNQQPVFATYKDDTGSINLFAGDQHSVAYASLTDSAGGTLFGDIVSGEFGNNTAGIWNLTCDQGGYELKINTIQ
jgi:hypothetical protein